LSLRALFSEAIPPAREIASSLALLAMTADVENLTALPSQRLRVSAGKLTQFIDNYLELIHK